MARLIVFLLLIVGAGWLLAFTMSGRNQKRALIGIGKIGVLVILGVMLVALLTLF